MQQIASLTSVPVGTLGEAEFWDIDVLIDTGVRGAVHDANALGAAVGEETDAHGTPIGAFVWQNGVATLLPQLVTADAINDSGQIAGTVASEAALYQNGQITLLGFLDGSLPSACSSVVALNSKGEVIGNSLAAIGVSHAYLWKNGIMADLGVMAAGDASSAHAFNNSDQVVGAESGAAGRSTAVLWQNGAVTALAQFGNDDYSYAAGINDSGLIVGAGRASGAASNATEALLWDQGQAISLNSLLPANSGWYLSTADSINDQGQIVGQGSFDGHAFTYQLTLGGTGTPQIGIAAQAAVAIGAQAPAPMALVDSVVDLQAYLDALEPLAVAGKLSTIGFTCTTLPTFAITDAQMAKDADVLAEFSGDFLVTAPEGTFAGFSGTASQYSVTAGSGGFSVTGNGADLSLSGVTALRFADRSEIVAQIPGSGGAATSGNLAELYGAEFGRQPDIGGLTFYQDYLQSHPATTLLQFADWFLASPEYTSAHSYVSTEAGDTQFIEDSYRNLLQRTPSQDEIDFYLTKVIDKASSQFAGHAQMLIYFSVSAEFLADVEVTAATPANAQHWLILT